MLVLSRKVGSRGKGKSNPKLTKIFIGDDVVVTILNAGGDNVKVGVEAPAGTPVRRGEVLVAEPIPQP